MTREAADLDCGPGNRLYRGQIIREYAWGARVEVEEALAGQPPAIGRRVVPCGWLAYLSVS